MHYVDSILNYLCYCGNGCETSAVDKQSQLSTCAVDTHARTHARTHAHTHTHTQPFNGPFSGTTWVSQYQKGETSLDFTEARDSEWQWHQLDHLQVCTSLQTGNHASTPPVRFLQAGCPLFRPTNKCQSTEGNTCAVDSHQKSSKLC